MSEQHEDPVAHASAKLGSYVSVAAMAAQAIAQMAAARAQERGEHDEHAASALRAERQAAYGQAQLGWAPVLDPTLRDRTDVTDAGLVWARAQPWRPEPEAERASGLAEERLRELRPDVMERYDRLRTEGTEPVDAMRRVAPYFDAPPARTGEPGPDRAALADADSAQQDADAHLALYRQGSATVDDPHTTRVNEHTDALAQAAPHRANAGQDDTRAAALHQTAARSPADLAAEGYPQPINAGSVDAAKAAAAGQPVSITTAAKRPAARAATATR